MPVSVQGCVHVVLLSEEFKEQRASADKSCAWVCIAGPYVLPLELDMMLKAVRQLGQADFRLVSENPWGTVVNLFRLVDKRRQLMSNVL